MSALLTGILGPMLIKLVLDAGAPLVRQVLESKIGKGNAALVEDVVSSIAKHAGVNPARLEEAARDTPTQVREAIQKTEAEMPEMIALYMAGLEGQFAMAKAEQREGGLASAWRWGWMYLLGFFWTWAFILVPLVNATTKSRIDVPPFSILLTLTGWFISLYMGGHTLKELGKNVSDAVKSWKDKP